MAGKDRKRQIARQRYERRLAARAQARAKARRRWAVGLSATAVVAIVAIVLAITLIGGHGTSSSASASSSPSASASAPPSPVPTSAPGCTTKPSAVASPVPNFPIVPGGVSDELKTEPTITIPAGAVPKTLQVKDLVTGSGPTVTSDDAVTVNYLGINYVDCSEFDSSWSRNEEATFALNGGVITGFSQGIAGGSGIAPMKVGGRREIIVPPSDGYGATGSGAVKGNEELVFVVDVLAATKAPSSSSAAATTSPSVTATSSATPTPTASTS